MYVDRNVLNRFVDDNYTASIRDPVQPIPIDLKPNGEGTQQKINFQPIADVTAGTVSVPLVAQSDSGLPVLRGCRAGDRQ